MALQIPNNLPLGSYETDGIRVGPAYNGLSSVIIDGQNNVLASYYDKYGRGVLTTPFNTWSITPYASSVICPAQAVPGGGWLTLVGSGPNSSAIATYPRGNENFPKADQATSTTAAPKTNYIQFDWPRVPQVIITGAGMTGPAQITIFGTDWYGFPMQSTYIIQAAGQYPNDITIPMGMKAFYTITAIYVRGVTAAGATLEVTTSNIFGLPYVLNNWGNVTTFNWNGHDLKSPSGSATFAAGTVQVESPVYASARIIVSRNSKGASGGGATYGIPSVTAITPSTSSAAGSFTLTALEANGTTSATDLSVISWIAPDGGESLIRIADPTTPISTPYTSDVRGLFTLPQTGETWDLPPNGRIPCIFTCYIRGADQWINQLAAGNQPQGSGTVLALTKADLYGVDQFYSGAPA